MKKDDKVRKISLVSLHQPLHWPNGGKLNSEKNLWVGKFPGTKFTEEENGVLIEYDNKFAKVPYAAIANWVFE